MSQILIDSLNNLNNAMMESLQSKKTDLTSAMDKSKDFGKTFEKTLTRPVETDNTKQVKTSDVVKNVDNTKSAEAKEVVETIKNTDEIKTLGDIRTKNIDKISAQELATFKEILAKANGEANVETSLDLTLAKDMSELIAKFKELLEKIKSDITTASDETKDALVKENTDTEEVEDSSLIDDLLNLISDMTEQKDAKEIDLSALCSQISLMFDSSLKDLTVDKTIDEADLKSLEQLKSMLKTMTEEKGEQIFDMNNQMVELADDVMSEVVSKSTSEAQDSIFELQLNDDLLKELNIEQIQADAGSSDFSENLMQQQSVEEHAVKAIINKDVEVFDIKIDKTVNIQQVQASQPKQVDANPSKILTQIAKQLEGLQNNSKVNIVLNPESLGKVNVQLLSTKEGLMAQFTVATQEARDALMKGLDGLKESLLSHGVSVDNVSVKMSEAQKSTYNPDWTEQEGSRGGNKEQGSSNKEEKEKGLFEKMMAQVNQENGEV